MANVTLPRKINGVWIWKQSLLNHPDSFLLMRKEFVCSSVGLETNLWISANCAYQLFINGRFVGFGPRAHQSCGISYIDQHEVTYYLESGINVIAVLLYYNVFPGGDDRRTPGLWCQMETEHQQVICSDESWFIYDGSCFGGHRARISPEQGMTQLFRAKDCPPKWSNPMFLPDANWQRPDYTVPVGELGAKLELHPLTPPVINEEQPPIFLTERGFVTTQPNWTQVVFDNSCDTLGFTYAADTYIFCEEECEIAVRPYTDDPFKFFCNNRLVATGEYSSGEEVVLPLRAGWNRLLLIQNPGCHSMGFFLVLPDEAFGRPFQVYQDMMDDAASGWNTVGPLKLSLAEATPSLRFERLQVKRYLPDLSKLTDPFSYLKHCVFSPAGKTPAEIGVPEPLAEREYLIYRLDKLRSGFVRVQLTANEGDVVDIITGLRRSERGLVVPAGGVRSACTIVCRKDQNMFLSFTPSDCFYVMIAVRSSSGPVRVTGVWLEELYRPVRHEASFRCSDELLNRFWEIGRQTLRRSAAFVPLAESRSDFDCYMLDAYIDAVNMAAVFGDFDYATARLRQFIDAQLENGDIPALTFGRRHASQIHHLFFFPVWIYYNYRFCANPVELERTVPSLDLTREYFEAMLDEETGLLVDVETRFGLHSRLSHGEFGEDEVPTYLNALFCRFLLSAAEIYRQVNQPGSVARCVSLAQRVAGQLMRLNFDEEAQLFGRWGFQAKRKPDHNLFANFCAMFGGVFPLESFERFFYAFFNYDPPFDKSEESEHPYFHFLFMEMMFAIGQRDWAFRYFRDYWARRICDDCDAWRISPDHPEPAPTKFSDGSCVSPNIFLLREVVGVRIAEAGHSVIYFNPAFNLIDWAEATLPMARGRLKVQWKKLPDGGLEVMLDSNVPVKILPEMTRAQLGNTEFRLGEKVTLLKPPDDLEEEDADGGNA